MAVRLRLRRMGKKKQPFYRIVAIDSRESRNGKYLENIGYYNPLRDPVDLNVKTDRALYWLQHGAQPSDTVKSLLRRLGVMLHFDLLKSGRSEEDIDQEIKKWQLLQDERVKRMEAARAQADREQAPKKEKTKAQAEVEVVEEEPSPAQTETEPQEAAEIEES